MLLVACSLHAELPERNGTWSDTPPGAPGTGTGTGTSPGNAPSSAPPVPKDGDTVIHHLLRDKAVNVALMPPDTPGTLACEGLPMGLSVDSTRRALVGAVGQPGFHKATCTLSTRDSSLQWTLAISVLERVKQLVVDIGSPCAIKAEDDRVLCWGRSAGTDDPLAGMPETVHAKRVEAGPLSLTCAIQKDESVSCWGSDKDVSGDKLSSVTHARRLLFGKNFCFVDLAGHVQCPDQCKRYVENDDLSVTCVPPFEPTVEIIDAASGSAGACAVTAAGAVVCDRLSTPDNLVAQRVFVGLNTACAVRFDGTVSCWKAGPTPVEVPVGLRAREIVQLDGGDLCASTPENKLVCWRDGHSRTLATGVALHDLVANSLILCGVTDEGEPRCWSLKTEQPIQHYPAALGGDCVNDDFYCK